MKLVVALKPKRSGGGAACAATLAGVGFYDPLIVPTCVAEIKGVFPAALASASAI
jgi:hypothetical protein